MSARARWAVLRGSIYNLWLFSIHVLYKNGTESGWLTPCLRPQVMRSRCRPREHRQVASCLFAIFLIAAVFARRFARESLTLFDRVVL